MCATKLLGAPFDSLNRFKILQAKRKIVSIGTKICKEFLCVIEGASFEAKKRRDKRQKSIEDEERSDKRETALKIAEKRSVL